MKVFIVDDSAIVRERLVEMLSEIKGVEILGEARDGVEAIEAICRVHPDGVILDVRMPGRNGIKVLEDIKRNQPAPVVLMLTNFPYLQYRKKCLDAGADGFLDKSIEFHKMAEALKFLQGAVRAKS